MQSFDVIFNCKNSQKTLFEIPFDLEKTKFRLKVPPIIFSDSVLNICFWKNGARERWILSQIFTSEMEPLFGVLTGLQISRQEDLPSKHFLSE